MGTIKQSRLIVLIVVLSLAALIVYTKPSQNASGKKESLSQALRSIKGWQNAGQVEIDQRVIRNLALDDYVYERYLRGKQAITLYIGYYYETAKIGAAHDPFVCFPGQGWVVSEAKKGQFEFHAGTDYAVRYSSMIVERDQKKELVVYWFQSFDRGAADTFSQKVIAFWQKIRGMPGDNALVRITVSMGSESPSEYIGIANEFVQSFYPAFAAYIKS